MTPSSIEELLLDWEGLQDIFSAAQEEKSTDIVRDWSAPRTTVR